MNTFHHSPLSSDRLQRVLRALMDAHDAGLTTTQLNELTNSTRGASDASELRAALRERQTGLDVACDYVGLSQAGRKVFRYRLIETV